MSVSPKLAKAFQVQKALGGKMPTTRDSSQVNGYNPKRPVIKCRRCDGLGLSPEGTNCPQCGGKGIEKLSWKAIKKLQAEQSVVGKIKDTTEKIIDRFMGGLKHG